MDFVITLLADKKKIALSEAFVQSMVLSLASQEVAVQKIGWIADGEACELFTQYSALGALNSTIQAILADQPYDAIAQEVSKRQKKLLISDMDSTMITVECIDELADFVGKKAEVSAITERAMNGELNFEEALSERVALLAGMPEEILQECYNERVKMMAGAKELLADFKENGGYSVLVSGGFTFFTSRVRKELGFDADFANKLEIKDGRLTGKVILPILGKEAKLAKLQEYCIKLNISADEVIAIGDGANDLPMLLAAGLGVAYHAKPVVRAQANAQLNHCDLSVLRFVIKR
ncbi:MAG: phosphoserine phosphatase SerB [Rickettsiales bacterium]